MPRPEWYRNPDLIGCSDDLKPIHESPLAYHDQRAKPPGHGDTASRSKLRAIHALILEGAAAFRSEFVVSNVTRRKGTAPFLAVQAEAAGRDILNEREYTEAAATASAVRAHPWVADRLAEWGGPGWTMRVEEPMRWRESVAMADPPAVWPPLDWDGKGPEPVPPAVEVVEVECKGINDAIAIHAGERRGVILDCKGVPTLKTRPLMSHLEKMLYHVQFAQYHSGAAHLAPWVTEWRLLWLCYQTKPPYDARWIEMSAEDLEFGQTVRTRLLRAVIEARRSGERIGGYTGVEDSQLPAWETRQDNASTEEVW